MLFRERLSISNTLTEPLRHAARRVGSQALLLAAVLAGALHDIGKASPYYSNMKSFLGHEIAGATLIYRASRLMLREGKSVEALLLHIAAWAVARHHSAMIERHPMNLGDRFRRAAIKAVESLANYPVCVLEGTPKLLAHGWIGTALVKAAREAGQYEPAAVVNNALEGLRTYNEATSLPDKISAEKWAAYVSMTTGALIVADILVARYEGRGTDEGAGLAYVKWWHRELGKKVEEVRRLTSNPANAEIELKRILSPLLSVTEGETI